MNLANFYDRSQHTDTPPAGTGGGAPQQVNTDAQKTAAQQAEHKAATLFDTMPQGERKTTQPTKTDEDRAAKLYSSESTYQDTVLIADLPANATAEQIAQANAEYRAELNNMELPGVLGRQLTERFTTAMRAPLSDAEYDAKAAGFKNELARRFGGAEHVEERLADVQKLLAKASPHVIDGLVESGLNFDVDTIAALADHARSLKGRGRL